MEVFSKTYAKSRLGPNEDVMPRRNKSKAAKSAFYFSINLASSKVATAAEKRSEPHANRQKKIERSRARLEEQKKKER